MTNKDWEISRKAFVKTLALGGLAMQLPWLQSCSDDKPFYRLPKDTSPLSKNQFRRLQAVLTTLFPHDGNGPGAIDFNADLYLIWVLNDTELDPAENDYIIEKLNEMDEFTQTQTGNSFIHLSAEDQFKLLNNLQDESWGKIWLSRLLTLIFEALLLDPAYGGNVNNIGWDWLEHNPGYPRPIENIQYPNILDRKHEV